MIVVLKKPAKYTLCVVIVFALVFGQLVFADEQSWLKNNLDISISSRLKAKLSQEARYDEITFMLPYLSNIEGGLDFSFYRNVSISLLFRRQNEKSTNDVLKEKRFMVDLNWKKKFGQKVAVDVRFRTEIRSFGEGQVENHLRFRLRLRLQFQCKSNKFEMKPFIAIEPFGDTLSDEVNRYRLYLGTVLPLSNNIGFLISYIRQGTKDKETLHILNSGFQLKF